MAEAAAAPAAAPAAGGSAPAPGSRQAAYHARRRKQVQAKQRGPFVRDTATEAELSTRCRSIAYRQLCEVVGSGDPVPELRLGRDATAAFGKFVDTLVDEQLPQDRAQLLVPQGELDAAVASREWVSVPKLEKWLHARVGEWAGDAGNATLDSPRKSTAPPVSADIWAELTLAEAQGTRQYMEDTWVAVQHWPQYFGQYSRRGGRDGFLPPPGARDADAPAIEPVPGSAWFVGLFDGHAGTEAAAFARDLLPTAVLRSPRFPATPADADAVVDAFRDGIDRTHEALLGRAREVDCTAGTTALCCLLWGTRLFYSYLGDCGAVLASRGDVRPPRLLTRTHTCTDPEERAAVEARGGTILHIKNQPRVNGQICVTRSIGMAPCQHVLSHLSEGGFVELQPDDDFLVLGTDGLWDVFSPEKAVAVVRELRTGEDATGRVEYRKGRRRLAEALVHRAIGAGSTDNTTACVLFLHPPGVAPPDPLLTDPLADAGDSAPAAAADAAPA